MAVNASTARELTEIYIIYRASRRILHQLSAESEIAPYLVNIYLNVTTAHKTIQSQIHNKSKIHSPLILNSKMLR